MAVTPDQRKKFWRLVDEGWNHKQAAEKAGFSESTARRLVADRRLELSRDNDIVIPGHDDFEPRANRTPVIIPERPVLKRNLSPIAADCLEDFARFRARYFGRKSSPWQEHAAYVVQRHLKTEEKAFLLINVAPGGGKSTTFTHDIPAWITVKNRSIRGFIGSSSVNIAKSYTGRLRNTFERTVPEEADEEALRLGLGMDAQATLPQDYGRFRPLPEPDMAAPPWSIDRFTVVQHGETSVSDKESTWSAWGWDSEFIGWRVNWIIWDDLVTPDNAIQSLELQTKMRNKWTNTAEKRLEPGGCLVLQGQRLGAEDLYRFCKDRMVPDFDEYAITELDLDADEDEDLKYRPKYHHIVYPAHVEDKCKGKLFHRKTAPPYDPADPDNSGCLLDPLRISWQEQLEVMTRDPKEYATVYQQKDGDPTSVLIPQLWIDGGEDELGTYPGCWDEERSPGEIPYIYPGSRTFSYVTVDPSPSNFWAIQWWLYVEKEKDLPNMGNRYLIDMLNKRMQVNDFLDFNVDANNWTGMFLEWADRAKRLHHPFNYLIFEKNAAQKFVMQYSWFTRFLRQRNIQLMGHVTGLNKADPDYGVGTLRSHYRFGRKRLPGTATGRQTVNSLVYELTHHPDAATDDTVMADWFGEFHLPRFVNEDRRLPDIYQNMRPEFLTRI